MVDPTRDRHDALAAVGDRIASRYRIEAVLGQGGMGAVYLGADEVTGRQVALKRMRADPKHEASLSTFFMREYHTLKQLAHPCIIEAHDYGIDASGPYYTMELLTGCDLAELAPMPWHDCCAMLRDIASALSLIHSRQLVHRDVSPRNVRRTENGRAKLIDFGALASMGVCSELMGTPPFIPPEAANGQALDARSDLYSLGALGYWLLTGRNAYPAKSIRALRDLWRSRPAPISALKSEVPRTLESLIVSMLSLDPLARPVNANEVIERLTAIGSLPNSAELAEARPYLTTPSLVGRSDHVLRLRRQLLRATREHGSTAMIEAPGGLGRTRMLQAVELEGRLAGATVLRLSATACASRSLGIAEELCQRLMELQPEAALAEAQCEAGMLGHLSSDLHQRLGGGELVVPKLARELPGMVHRAVCDWLLRVSRRHCLVIAVDDAEQADERSLALLAALAQRSASNRFALVVAVDTSARVLAPDALAALRRGSGIVTLEPLDAAQTQALVRSVFGDVPHLTGVADWIFQLAEGSPRACIELMQHMLDHGVVRYESASFSLPSSLREHALPRSVNEATRDVIARLPAPARELAQALALSALPLHLAEYPLALGLDAAQQEAAFAAIDAMVNSRVLVIGKEHYAFRHHAYAEAARCSLDPDAARRVQLRLARIYELRDDLRRQAEHLLNAGEELLALATLLRHLERTNPGTGLFGAATQTLFVPATDGSALIEDTTASVAIRKRLLEVCARYRRPPRESFMIRGGLLYLANQHDLSAMADYIGPHLEDLLKYTGAIYWDATPADAPPVARARDCFARAQREYDTTLEQERVIAPRDAIGALVINIGLAQGYGRQSFDVELLERAVDFAARFRDLSRAHRMSHQGGLHVLEGITGRHDHATRVRRELFAEYDALLAAGTPLQPSVFVGLFLLIQWEGIERALRGGEEALTWAQKLEDSKNWPWLGPNQPTGANVMGHMGERRTWEVRRLCHLYNGNAEGARSCLEQIERLTMQHTFSAYGGGAAFFEAQAHALSGDLLGLKQSVDAISKIVSQQYRGWQPFLDVANGDYHRLRGELAPALAHYERALVAAAPGRHAAWAPAAVGRLETLIEQGRSDEARSAALAARDAGERAELGENSQRELGRVLALAEAHAGDVQAGAARLERSIEDAQRAGLLGLPLGVLFESRARIALLADDVAAFDRFVRLTSAQYRPGRNPALIAKYERLIEAARARATPPFAQLEQVVELASSELATDRSAIGTQLERTAGDVSHARRALAGLLRERSAQGAALYALRGQALELVAAIGLEASAELARALHAQLDAELERPSELTLTCFDRGAEPALTTESELGKLCTFVIARNEGDSSSVLGIAALVAADERPTNPTTLRAIADALSEYQAVVSVYVPE